MKRRHRKDRGDQQTQKHGAHRSNSTQGKPRKSKRELHYQVAKHPSVELKQIVWNYRKRLYLKPLTSTGEPAPPGSSAPTATDSSVNVGRRRTREAQVVESCAKERGYSEGSESSSQQQQQQQQRVKSNKSKEVVITYPADDPQGREEYVGTIRSGKMHGHGSLLWSCGSKYVGQFENDKLTGVGTYSWSNGKEYSGEWVDGRANGLGRLRMNAADADNTLLEYDGAWKNGLMSGQGMAKMLNGDTYQGEWYCNHKHGKGVYVWANGCRYEGEFEENVLHGKGTCYWPNGRALELAFENNCASDAMECAWSIYYFFIFASIVNIFYDFAVNPQGPQIRQIPSGSEKTAWNVLWWYKTLFAQLLPEVRLLLLFCCKMKIVKFVGSALTKFALFACLKRSSKNVPNTLCWKEGVGLGSVLFLIGFLLTFLLG